MIFHHGRYQIWNKGQHPYSHNLSELFYTNPALPPGVAFNAEQALNWIFANLYPQTKTAVATPAALPLGGNTLNDYRVVYDDGDGKAASYRWEQREGEVAPSWHKVYDMDWGADSILSSFLNQTDERYYFKFGQDDLDGGGVPLAGDLSGQHLYGGFTAGSHLTLHANAGDGVGAQSGFIQLADNARPFDNEMQSLGTNLRRWLKVWTKEAAVGTMTLAGGVITDSSGTIDFDNENLITDGNITAGGTVTVNVTMVLASGSITDTSGAISFGNEDLTTTGDFAANKVTATGAASSFASGTTVGTLTLANGSITDTSGVIDFGNEDLTTLGTITGGDFVWSDGTLSGNNLTYTSAGNFEILAALGSVDIQSPLITLGQTVTGNVNVTGNITTIGAGSKVTTPAIYSSGHYGVGGVSDIGMFNAVMFTAYIYPNVDNARDIGYVTSGHWRTLFLSASIKSYANEMSMATLMSLRDINSSVATGQTIFWNGTKWVASYPDTEVDHGTITGLGDDDHYQYALLTGRASGQSLIGGTGANDDLYLDSTAHATKGRIVVVSPIVPSSNGVLDIGTGGQRFKDIYLSGQGIGFRFQNASTAGAPAASGSTIGRAYYNTDDNDVYIDTGGAWRKISVEKHYFTDPTGWDGIATSVVYTVSSTVSDARSCLWALYDNADSFKQLAVDITKTATQVTVTVLSPLPAGSYTLVGVG